MTQPAICSSCGAVDGQWVRRNLINTLAMMPSRRGEAASHYYGPAVLVSVGDHGRCAHCDAEIARASPARRGRVL